MANTVRLKLGSDIDLVRHYDISTYSTVSGPDSITIFGCENFLDYHVQSYHSGGHIEFKSSNCNSSESASRVSP